MDNTLDSKILNPLKENNFNELRLFFSFIVMIFHIGQHSQVEIFHYMTLFSAKFAVQGFFVISGFLVYMSYVNTKNLKNYFKSVELYKYILYNLALSNFSQPNLPGVFVNNLDHSVNGSLWTIKIEVGFYFIVPLLALLIKNFNKNYLLVIFFLSILWNLVFNIFAIHFHNELFLRLARQMPGQLSFFVGGILAYLYSSKHNPKPAVSTILCMLSIIFYFYSDGIVNDVVAPFAVTSIVYWAAIIFKPTRILNNRADISYGLYLYHFPVIQVFVALGLFSLFPVAALILCLALVIAISLFSWHFIEYPFLYRA